VKRLLRTMAACVSLVVIAIQPASAIVYGEDDDGKHPNVGSMLVVFEGQPFQFCTGTLIAKGVFLTAAHCTAGVPQVGLSQDDVRITFNGDGVSDLIKITGWYEDPRFDRRQSNPYDIAVIYFDPDATSAGPAQVAGPGYLGSVGKKALRKDRFTVVGYGAVRTSKRKGPQGILDNMQRNVATQSMSSMAKAWLTLAMNDRSVANGGTCYGDSGGPHFHKGVLVSITVTGDAVCKATDKTYRLDTPWAQAFLDDALDG
jgi:secreted trypsin-like serine protease